MQDKSEVFPKERFCVKSFCKKLMSSVESPRVHPNIWKCSAFQSQGFWVACQIREDSNNWSVEKLKDDNYKHMLSLPIWCRISESPSLSLSFFLEWVMEGKSTVIGQVIEVVKFRAAWWMLGDNPFQGVQLFALLTYARIGILLICGSWLHRHRFLHPFPCIILSRGISS